MKSSQNKPFKAAYAKKSFGQNFLVDGNYINKIITALNPQADETIIEIGAGRGALTEKLIESGANVIAIELERDMIAVLRERFIDKDNFQLIESDALKIDFSAFRNPQSAFPIKLVANLPYYISTAILQKLIAQREVFSEMILMFQREVVERIIAEPGNRERGYLTVLTEAYLHAVKLFDVPPNAFRPPPKVWSAVVRLISKENKISPENERLFKQFISTSFIQKRRTLLNNLKKSVEVLNDESFDAEKIFADCPIDLQRRAETLTLIEWMQLFRYLYGK